MEKQTIVAPMTPNGVSAVAAIRVSGPQVKSVVKTLFGEKAVAGLKSHMAKLGTAKWPASVEGGCRTGAVIDSLLYLYLKVLIPTLAKMYWNCSLTEIPSLCETCCWLAVW